MKNVCVCARPCAHVYFSFPNTLFCKWCFPSLGTEAYTYTAPKSSAILFIYCTGGVGNNTGLLRIKQIPSKLHKWDF